MIELLDGLTTYPVALMSIPFAILLLLMIVSLLSGFAGDRLFLPGELDRPSAKIGLPTRLLRPAGSSHYPLVVFLTVTCFFATVLLYAANRLLEGVFGGWLYQAGTLVALVVSFIAGMHLATFALRPLAPAFDPARSSARIDYVGLDATVRSARVGATFGEVVVTAGGIENQIDAYCEGGEISYGESVVIRDYDAVTRRYRVERKA